MSRLVAFAAIQGGYKVVSQVEGELERALQSQDASTKIGFPTANIHIKESYKLIPKTGAYVVQSTIDDMLYFGMMNIGNRPTVDGKHQTIEVHFFDFNDDLYGETIQIELLKFLREEQKFNSLDDLKLQLQKDKITAQKVAADFN